MTGDHFQEVLTIGSKSVAIREERCEGDERVLTVDGAGVTHSVRLLSYYKPSVTVTGHTLGIWGGRRLFTINVADAAICNRYFDTDIVAVMPYERLLLVVTELEAVLVDDRCEVVKLLLTHDEVIVHTQRADRRLSVRDLQGRVVTVDIPES